MLKCVLITCVLCFYFDLITVYIYIQLLSILYSNCILEKCVVTILGILNTPLAQQVKKSFRYTKCITRRNLLQAMNDVDAVRKCLSKCQNCSP